MERIYKEAQKEQVNRVADEIIECLGSLQDSVDWKDILKEKLAALREEAMFSAEKNDRQAWNFSKEKVQSVFTSDKELVIRPFKDKDRDFYFDVHREWNQEEPVGVSEMLWQETRKDYSLFCVIEWKEKPVGYVGIRDTREHVWELEIELDKDYCYRGIGSKSIKLFLNRIKEITLISRFFARVEVDNIASQKCMDKINAELVGLSEGVFHNEEDCLQFEKMHLELIDNHMRELAEKLSVEAQKLLSHVLMYEIMV